MLYNQKLHDPRWLIVQGEILARDGYRRTSCGADGLIKIFKYNPKKQNHQYSIRVFQDKGKYINSFSSGIYDNHITGSIRSRGLLRYKTVVQSELLEKTSSSRDTNPLELVHLV